MSPLKFRKAIFYKTYFEEFFIQQNQKIKEKILWTIELIECIQKIPEKYLKHITGTAGLYEIRVQSSGEIFRIFCFFLIRKN